MVQNFAAASWQAPICAHQHTAPMVATEQTQCPPSVAARRPLLADSVEKVGFKESCYSVAQKTLDFGTAT